MLITQLTDLHLRPPGRAAYRVAETNMLTERAFGRLRTLRPQPDVVVITGDMTDCGLPEEYALLRTLLSALPMPVFMVPGNHDRRDNLKRAFADWPTVVADPDFVQFVVDDFPVRLIGLDTVVEKASAGALCKRRLKFLSTRLTPNRSARRLSSCTIHRSTAASVTRTKFGSSTAAPNSPRFSTPSPGPRPVVRP